MSKILIVDQSRSIRNILREHLEFEGYDTESANDNYAASELCNKVSFNIIITEYDTTSTYSNNNNNIPFIVMLSEISAEKEQEAFRNGAIACLGKPLDMNKLLKYIKCNIDIPAINEQSTTNDASSSAKANHLKPKFQIDQIIGESQAIDHVKNLIEKVAPSGAKVLIVGENGTGKELVARWLHAKSSRCSAPFIEINCAAIPSELIESELFGHEKGAFTSAIKQRKGKFEQADGGTLFLDEIGDMSLSAQAKVLRALQENKITRIGCDKDTSVNVRIVAATNKNLKEEIAKGNFREDLYHRVSVIVIKVPPLRERQDDIPILVNHFIYQLCKSYSIPTKNINANAIKLLQEMDWSGNIRELRNIIERLIILGDNTITVSNIKDYC